jgi:hypothetical protein
LAFEPRGVNIAHNNQFSWKLFMKLFGKHGLWILTGAAFLLLGVPRKAWAGVPELSQIPLLRAFRSELKKEPQAQVGHQRNGQDKPKVLLVTPLFLRQP